MRPIFSHGNCVYCAKKAYKPIKARASKPKEPSEWGFSNQVELFDSVWHNSINKTCYVSKQPLNKYYGTDKYYSLFQHVLPKKRFSKWKLNPDNIVLLDPIIHHLIDQGTEDQRIASGYDYTNYYKLKDELLLKYRETYGN